jgi:hypothetical protein
LDIAATRRWSEGPSAKDGESLPLLPKALRGAGFAQLFLSHKVKWSGLSSINRTQLGVWRQLSWPVGDNYDGRLGGFSFHC